MMGAEQEKWLFDNLATVKARWTVIGQQVYSFAYDRAKANPDGQFSMDKWDGYVAARQRLYKRLLETQAPNPIVLSGDVHQHYGADLKMDFTDPRSATVGIEFTNSSITTGGDGSDVGHDVGGDARRQPAHQVPQQPPRLHRLHGDARDDARRLQDCRQGERARSSRADRRVARRPGRATWQPHRLRRTERAAQELGRLRGFI